ncbi:hypothetical protein T4A_5078 [Trichinella pseudospiralis]|uniref:Uncharacterized protein n=1 Tax=Trichinella pseudospiralis TaxID=6337 RepID=A0A0V1AJY9_TRIPS|nr:hypothetical protein T4A_5078 [Trichinella pseudospiralis]
MSSFEILERCVANGIRLYLTFRVLIIVAWLPWKRDFRAVQKLAQIC